MAKLIEETSSKYTKFFCVDFGKYFISNNELYHRSRQCNSNCARHVISGEVVSFLSEAQVQVVEITAIHYIPE